MSATPEEEAALTSPHLYFVDETGDGVVFDGKGRLLVGTGKVQDYFTVGNLNISRYISTAVGETEIDLKATHGELVEFEKAIEQATKTHNAFLKELKLPPLPGV